VCWGVLGGSECVLGGDADDGTGRIGNTGDVCVARATGSDVGSECEGGGEAAA
jgi:hypothetical protein